MSLKEFFDNVFLKKESIKGILDLCSDQAERGKKFERCADLLIKLGFLSIYSPDKYKHVVGNVNEGKVEILNDINKYIERASENSGNTTGISDITLYNNADDTYIFISSKFYLEESSVKDYDIQDIIAMVDYNKHIYKNYKIDILVNNKADFLKKVANSRSSSNYMSNKINNIIDLNDLEEAFKIMKSYLNIGINIFDNFIQNKKVFYPKFHQKLFVTKLLKEAELNKKSFLLGLKPRSGKTFIVGFIVSSTQAKHETFNVLVITPAPTETTPQFFEMFDSYSDFNDLNIIRLDDKNMFKDGTFLSKKKNIILASKQFLQNYTDTDDLDVIKNLNLNYLFFDENHYGGTSDISTDVVFRCKSEETIMVFLTATFHKTLNHWNIPDECTFYWDLEDEQLCKKENIQQLVLKHGTIVDEILKEDGLHSLSTYQNMPELELITTLFETNIFNKIKNSQADHNKYGFSLRALFSITNSKFNYENEIDLLLRYISGSDKETDFPDGDKSIFGRIIDISVKRGSRTTLSNSSFTTQLWFLPFGLDLKINDVSQNLKIIMLQNRVLKHYEILILNSNIDKPIKDIKHEIKRQEAIGKENGKRGLIILVGNQCSLGITLENCDVVILLNDILSSDKIYQMMYRSMTEAPNKKCGYVVDLNISRVLNTVIDYSLHKETTIDSKIRYIIENNLINIDSDYFLNKKKDTDIIINNLLEVWKRDPINNLRKLLRNIENEILDINSDDQTRLNNIFTKSFEKSKTVSITIGEQDGLLSGQTIKKEKLDEDQPYIPSDEESDASSIADEISFTKDILPFIIPLICFLTIKDNNKNFLKMLHFIKHNTELLDIFNEQTFIWWNKRDIIDLINYLIQKYIKENSDIYNMTINIKMTLQSLIDKPTELLNFINDSLKPKDVEKKKFGEVFTPPPLIDEMLDTLPTHLWSNPDLKWLDPANGMGNFVIAIYFRLMEGLKDKFPDTPTRKKHILEKMLYMSEINKKNCFIAKQIFDINNEYKLNIYNGDTLTLDVEKEWNIKQFDIIVGNPPYQSVTEDGVVKGGGNNLYTKFIYMSDRLLKENGFLLYITPPTFFSIGRSNNKDDSNVRRDVFNNYFIHHINLEECAKYFKVGSKFIYYLMEKRQQLNPTMQVICKYNKKVYTTTIHQQLLNDSEYLPYLLTNDSLSICNKIKSTTSTYPKLAIFHSPDNRSDKKHVKKTKDEEHKYPMQATGSQVHYSSKECKNQTDKKILMSESGYLQPFYDDGINGVGGHCFALLVKDKSESDYLIKLINSNLYKFYIEINKWSGFHHVKVLQALSYVKLENDFTDEDLYAHFGLTETEIGLIKEIYDSPATSKDDDISVSSSKSGSDSNSVSALALLCGAPLKKKGELCKSKPAKGCNGRCKRHSL